MGTTVLEKVQKIETEMNHMFVERQDVIRGSIVALLSRVNVLVLGAPGTAKSMQAQELCSRIEGAQFFRYLLTKFTTPEEIFGPFSLQALKENQYYRLTKNCLPEANIAFLDEIYKGSSAIANTLLTIINERIFQNKGEWTSVPLETLFAASNEMPADSEELGAFHDRFHLKYEVRYIHEHSGFVQMLRQRYEEGERSGGTCITLDELKAAQTEVKSVKMTDEVYELYDKIRFNLGADGTVPSDRSFNVSQDIIKAEAWLLGLEEVIPECLAILYNVLWDDPKQQASVKRIVLQAASKELLELEKAYDESRELIRPRKTQDDNEEIKETLEVRKKLRNNLRVLQEGVEFAKKKGLPCFKYESMVESVKNRIFQLQADVLGEDIDDIMAGGSPDGQKKATKKSK